MSKNKWEISSFGWHNISGVYCVFTINIDTKKIKLYYIGSSKDIGKRIMNKDHPYKQLLNRGLVPFIKFKETNNYIDLEKKLIMRLNPPMNKQYTRYVIT